MKNPGASVGLNGLFAPPVTLTKEATSLHRKFITKVEAIGPEEDEEPVVEEEDAEDDEGQEQAVVPEVGGSADVGTSEAPPAQEDDSGSGTSVRESDSSDDDDSDAVGQAKGSAEQFLDTEAVVVNRSKKKRP